LDARSGYNYRFSAREIVSVPFETLDTASSQWAGAA
jgi:hypothetical protein